MQQPTSPRQSFKKECLQHPNEQGCSAVDITQRKCSVASEAKGENARLVLLINKVNFKRLQ